MREFKQYREQFADLYAAVKKNHQTSGHQHRGHGLDHDAAVAQMGALIAPDDEWAKEAWAAGIIHSTDRIYPNKDEFDFAMRRYADILRKSFKETEVGSIIVSVLVHSEKNNDGDSFLTKILKDADRLINMQPLIVTRGAQHTPEIPAIELEYLGRRNPASTFRNPCNCMDNLRHVIEWVSWLRLPKAKFLGQELADYLQDYINRAEKTYHELGLAGVEL